MCIYVLLNPICNYTYVSAGGCVNSVRNAIRPRANVHIVYTRYVSGATIYDVKDP